jgi:DNA (cytosine-5)-methyltransferase 1
MTGCVVSDVDCTQELPTVLSLCTGYGGIERGLELAGFEHRTVAHVEIEAFAAANLVAKMETGQLVPAPVWSDLKTLPAHCFRDRVDVLTGGYPCQPFSAAGLRKGAEDPRHLWPYIYDHIRTIRPVRCFFENVEGHITLGLRDVIADLESLGYATTWGVFSASEVGAPHQRKRVYILAYTDSAGQQPSERQPRSPEARHNAGRGGKTLADTDSQRQRGRAETAGWQAGPGTEGSAATNVADANSKRLSTQKYDNQKRQEGHSDRRAFHRFSGRSETLADASSQRSQGTVWEREAREEREPTRHAAECGAWESEPKLGRVVDGGAFRVDRLRLLGNGVVPHTAAKAWIVLNDQLAKENHG